MSLQISSMQRPLWLSFTQCEFAVMRELLVPGFGIILKGFGIILKDGDEDRDRGSGGKSERTKTIGAGLDFCSHKGTQAHLLHQPLRDTATSAARAC